MKQEYIFSFYGQTTRTEIKHPKCFQSGKKAKLVETNYHCRKSVYLNLTEEENSFLSRNISLEDSLLHRLTFANWDESILHEAIEKNHKPNSMQLEIGSPNISYIATSKEKDGY
jgi:hypothetical protein